MYEWITRRLRGQGWREQGKKVRGLLRRYVEKMTGLSRTQVTRLVARYEEHSEVKNSSYRRHRFASRYTRADIELLAAVDEAHETLAGPATKKILEREFGQYKQAEYERLAGISVAHIYNLRRHKRYRERRMNYSKTRPVQVAIGERRKPQPDGRVGHYTNTFGAGFTDHSAAISFCGAGLSLRQRLGVYQRKRVRSAQETADRADQIASA